MLRPRGLRMLLSMRNSVLGLVLVIRCLRLDLVSVLLCRQCVTIFRRCTLFAVPLRNLCGCVRIVMFRLCVRLISVPSCWPLRFRLISSLMTPLVLRPSVFLIERRLMRKLGRSTVVLCGAGCASVWVVGVYCAWFRWCCVW